MKLMEMIDPKSDFFSMLIKKLAPPLVTLLATEPEIQYVSLRNINFIVQKRFVLYLTSLPYCKLWTGINNMSEIIEFGLCIVIRNSTEWLLIISAKMYYLFSDYAASEKAWLTMIPMMITKFLEREF